MRARNLKPSLFKHELLATTDPLYTWVFQGLWCIADREGRLEDRPQRIHLEINPGRAYEGTVQSLDWLEANGFITRYEAGGVRVIQVLAFGKHQNPHHKEPPSKLPEPEASPGQAPGIGANKITTKPEASPGQEPDKSETRPIPTVLIPDSGFPLPDSGSLNPPTSVGEARSEAAAHAPPPKAAPGPNRKRRGSLAHFVPEDFEVPLDDYRWALEQGYSPEFVKRETERFCDHEFAKPRSDWVRCWRNWITKDPPRRAANGQTFRAA
jgi:hypothetical protein